MFATNFFLNSLCYKYISSFFSLLDTNDPINNTEINSLPFQISMKKEFFKMGASLILLLVFLFISVWLFKKFLKSKGNIFTRSSLIKIIDKRNISQKSSLYIIKITNKLLVISESSAGIQYITELPAETDLTTYSQENNNTLKSYNYRDSILKTLTKLKLNTHK